MSNKKKKKGFPEAKFTDEELMKLLAQNIKPQKIAEKFKVDISNVYKRIRKLKRQMNKDLSTLPENRNVVWANQVRASEILAKIHKAVDNLLDETRLNARLVNKLAYAVQSILKLKDAKKQRDVIKKITIEISKDRQLMLAASKELREQVKLQLEIAKTLHSMQVVAEFQQSVLDVLETVDPKMREAVLKGLEEKRLQRIAMLE